MTTPHEAVTEALIEAYRRNDDDAPGQATAAIGALRELAKEAVRQLPVTPSNSQIVNAILGPPNEVPE